MKKAYLIIQRTVQGLDNKYTSDDLPSEVLNSEEIKHDERGTSVEIANRSSFYTLMNNDEYQFFSYVNTRVTDIGNRSGYYAIRLIVPLGYKVIGIKNILDKLVAKYENYIQQNDNNQNYDDILNSIELDKTEENFIITKKFEGSYYLYLESFDDLDKYFGDTKLRLLNKLYFFDKNKAQSEDVAQNYYSMSSVTSIDSLYRIIQVDNSNGYLRELKINKKDIDFKNKRNFKIICDINDEVLYRASGRKTYFKSNHSKIDVPSPPPPPPPPPPKEPKEPTEWDYKKIAIALFVIVALLGGIITGGYYLFFKKETQPEIEIPVKPNQPEEPKQTVNDSIESIKNDSITVEKDSIIQEKTIIKEEKIKGKEAPKTKNEDIPKEKKTTETTPANPDKKDKKPDDKQKENKEQEKNQDL